MQEDFLRWIVLFPLLGSGLIAALGRWLPRAAVGIMACASVGASFVTGLIGHRKLVALAVESHEKVAALSDHFYTWLALDKLNVGVSFVHDPLSSVICTLPSSATDTSPGSVGVTWCGRMPTV